MDLTTFPPISLLLEFLYKLVATFDHTLVPTAGASSAVLAIVALTCAVRLLLIPVGLAQVRAEIGRRRLAPAIARLRKTYAGKPEQLQKALTQLYTSEKVSPLAGCLPTLAQAPVLTAIYTLFAHSRLAGHANLLLSQSFAGVPLGANLLTACAIALAHVWIFIALLVVLALVMELTRRSNRRWTSTAANVPPDGTPGTVPALRFLPLVSVIFAALAPFAAAIYLVTSATWTLGERAILRRALNRQHPAPQTGRA